MAEYLTINQVAKMLSVSKGTVYRYVNKRLIPYMKVAGNVRFKEEDIRQWVESNRVKTDEEMAQ